MILYIACTPDKYELPLAVADTAEELGEMLGNEMTETQLKALSTDAQVMYTALMTDTLIEEV